MRTEEEETNVIIKAHRLVDALSDVSLNFIENNKDGLQENLGVAFTSALCTYLVGAIKLIAILGEISPQEAKEKFDIILTNRIKRENDAG